MNATLRTILSTGFVLALALGGGIASVDMALDRFPGFGDLKVGAWTAWPQASGADADPYAKARAARKATLSLGAAEGLAFYAGHTDDGRTLRRGCAYRLTGFTPPARFWTLYAATPDLAPLEPRPGLPATLHSREALFDADGGATVTIGPDAAPGDWLAVEGGGDFVLVMTLYDTPAASSSGLADLVMPRLAPAPGQEGCGG